MGGMKSNDLWPLKAPPVSRHQASPGYQKLPKHLTRVLIQAILSNHSTAEGPLGPIVKGSIASAAPWLPRSTLTALRVRFRALVTLLDQLPRYKVLEVYI